MVTFSCEVCNESMLKKKADQHTQRCYGAYFTCIDCSITFNGADYRKHTQCITEDEKYQKALFRPKKKQPNNQANGNNNNSQKKQEQTQHTQEKKIEKSKDVPKKGEKSENSKPKVSKVDLKEHKGKGLYKVLKNLSKDDKKELLKRIIINKDGHLELQ